MAVHAAIGKQAVEMKARSILLCIVNRFQERLVFKEPAVLDLLRDPGQILIHDPSGAHVQVSHLGASHLPFRKAHGKAAGIAQGEGAFLHQAVHHRRIRQCDRIVLFFFPESITVEDQQDGRPLTACILGRMRTECSGQNTGC